MGKIYAVNRWLVEDVHEGRAVRILAPPSPYELLSPDDAMVMAAWLLAAAGCDRERFRVILDAVLDA